MIAPSEPSPSLSCRPMLFRVVAFVSASSSRLLCRSLSLCPLLPAVSPSLPSAFRVPGRCVAVCSSPGHPPVSCVGAREPSRAATQRRSTQHTARRRGAQRTRRHRDAMHGSLRSERLLLACCARPRSPRLSAAVSLLEWHRTVFPVASHARGGRWGMPAPAVTVRRRASPTARETQSRPEAQQKHSTAHNTKHAQREHSEKHNRHRGDPGTMGNRSSAQRPPCRCSVSLASGRLVVSDRSISEIDHCADRRRAHNGLACARTQPLCWLACQFELDHKSRASV